MHVRGSSLSHPEVVEALRPFIVTFWGQSNNERLPDDVLPLHQASGGASHFATGSNVRCFVLDADGRLLHWFNGFPNHTGNPTGRSSDEFAAYYIREINRSGAGRTARRAEMPLKLPEVGNGVRLFIRFTGQRDAYASPVVEAVESLDEWKTLSPPTSAREIDAAKLSRWLRLCYPAGVNEQLEPYTGVHGKLTLTPAGPNQAVLAGKVRMDLPDRKSPPFDGTFRAVLTYGTGGAVRLRGVVEGGYPRFDWNQVAWADWPLTVAIESRPD